MAAPSNPSVGDTYQHWTFDGEKWVCAGGGGAGALEFAIAFPFIGKPGADGEVNVAMVWPTEILASMEGTKTYARVPPTANAAFVVNKISGGVTTQIGTITLTSSTTATLTGVGGQLAVGDVLQLISPGTEDATLEDVGITILAIRV